MARRTRPVFDADIEDSDGDADFKDEDVKLEIAPVPRPSRESREPRQSGTSGAKGRVENLRDRMQLFYGTSDAELVRAIELRVKWGDLLFSIPETEISKNNDEELVASHEEEQMRTQGSRVPTWASSSVSNSGSNSDSSLASTGWPCVVDGFVLAPHESRKCEDAVIFNAGYAVLSLDWSHLLAVAVRVTSEPPIDASTIDEFKHGHIYLYDVSGPDVRLTHTLTAPGVRELKWRPDGLGLCVLANGNVFIVDATDKNAISDSIESCPQLPSLAAATCVHWRTNEDLVVGYADGYIAEFCVANAPNFGPPSFVARPHSSVVTALSSSGYCLFTTSVDGWSCVYRDVRDKRLVAHAPRLRFYAPCACYSSAADSFVCLEDGDTTRLIPKRRPDLVQTQTALTRHRAGVASVATSDAHPLVISGGYDGELHITNPLRRTMVTRRNKDIHYDCAVWRLECAPKTSEFRFVDLLEASPVEKRKVPAHLPLYPASVGVLSLAWQPNSTWYAAGTASGLIRIETAASSARQ